MHRTRVLRSEFGPMIVLFPPRRGRSEHRQRRHRVPAEADRLVGYKVANAEDLVPPLPAIFPTGVRDYSQPGVEQQPPLGTCLDYGTD
jgi:hypothetical protein